jgi:hypothetical protein
VNGRKKEGVTEDSEEVNVSEQQEAKVPNPCSHGVEKKNLALQHMHVL